ncbi:MAG: DUF1987 domain-containing protein [Bacteroidales bacterium]|nr:DUF1987 domain-containing protein [Bacteroidales bacterium]
MKLEKTHILPTADSPDVLLDPDGIIKIKGRGMVVNRTVIPDQILNWLDAYLIMPAETTSVIIALEYLNSFSTKILTAILLKISQVWNKGKNLSIRWYYEEDDDDILERGEYISEAYNIPIEFIITDDLAEC